MDEETPTELEILQEINDNIKYLIKKTIPNSVYSDFEFPTEDDSNDSSDDSQEGE